MISRLWQSGLPSLAAVAVLAVGLLASPAGLASSVTALLRDALYPGLRFVEVTRERGGELAQSLPALRIGGAAESPAVATAERDDAGADERLRQAAYIRQLEAALALTRDRLQAAERDNALALSPAPFDSPLALIEPIPARVIDGSSRVGEKFKSKLINAGRAVGLSETDLVLDASDPVGLAGDDARILIDRGADTALAIDSVVSHGHILVGRVQQIGQLTSQVQLVTDPEFRIAARVVRRTNSGPVFGAEGVFAGDGAFKGRLELVANTEPLGRGDLVYTAVDVPGDPVWLCIGQITSAELPPGEPHWRVEVRPLLPASPDRVTVLKTAINPRRLAELPSSP
ncbi:MAG: rod shape-determining protein MreC [Planctomycetaceae bacterium]